jgi:signal transduction histidine kinase
MAGTSRTPVATRALDRVRRDRGVGVLTALAMGVLVVLVYAAAVGVERLFGRTGPPGLILSVAVTAAVSIAFEPVRVRTRRLLARLVHADGRSRAEVLSGFAASVAGRYPVIELPQRIAAVVGEGTDALRSEVWLMVNGRLERAATWVADGAANTTDDTGLARHQVEVRDRGELLGRLILFTTAGDRLSTVERRLVYAVADQSGLLLRVTGLRVELRRRLADLQQRSADVRRARRDLVVRQDAERKRLERNIHDGAQQEVIALLVNLRLVQTLLGRAPDRAVGLLAGQAEAFRTTISTLTELAHGLYPQTLTEQGPVPALRAIARRSLVAVALTADELPRLPADLEAAIYFCAVEAMQNAAKHASVSGIRIDIRFRGTRLAIDISDDGVGFDPQQVSPGQGLANIRDRVESLGGRLQLTSDPGRGTRLDIELPMPSEAG